MWVWVKLFNHLELHRRFGPGFHLPGQPVLGVTRFLTRSISGFLSPRPETLLPPRVGDARVHVGATDAPDLAQNPTLGSMTKAYAGLTRTPLKSGRTLAKMANQGLGHRSKHGNRAAWRVTLWEPTVDYLFGFSLLCMVTSNG